MDGETASSNWRGRLMSVEMVVEVGQRAAETMLLVASPMLGLALLVGLLIGMFQAMTQINEATLTFVPKIIAIVVALVVFSPWMLEVMLGFMTSILLEVPSVAR